MYDMGTLTLTHWLFLFIEWNLSKKGSNSPNFTTQYAKKKGIELALSRQHLKER